MQNCVDLAVAHARINDISNNLSLKSLCELYTGRCLSKNILIIRSNWGGEHGGLSPSQIEYAANDSEASFDVCEKILESISCNPSERIHFLSSCLNIDKPQVTGKMKNEATRRKDVSADWCKGRIKPYYDNINVLNPSGDIVFTVDKTKAKWYVEKKKLATVVEWRGAGESREMATIQLTFSPNVEKYEDSHIRRNLDYFKSPKENICVVCGADQQLVRFAVVPLLYRKHFPSVYMSHNSYDLLLLCTTCFGKASAVYEKERAAVAKDFGIPLGHLTSSGVVELENEIKKFESSIDDGLIMKRMEDDLVAHHIHPCIQLSLMKEFCEVQYHRNMIIQIIRYANAIYNHYKSVGIIHDSRDDSGKRKNNAQPTSLPSERFIELKEYMEKHAYTYPFCKGEQKISSPEGVSLLLLNGKVSHQEVLRLFWLEKHPEIVDEIPPRTRTEKDETDNNLPVFEGHGFLVVRGLLKKYSDQGNWKVGKRGEHAVGQFIFRWRNVFLKHMEPKYLPDGWVPEDGILQ